MKNNPSIEGETWLVLHEVSQPGWWLMRWTAGDRSELDFGAKRARAVGYIMAGDCSFQNGHYMLRMIVIAFFQQLAVLSSAFMQLHGLLFLFLLYIERGILIYWWLTLRGWKICLLRSARNWNYPLYSGWLSGPGWPGKRDYMEKFQPG